MSWPPSQEVWKVPLLCLFKCELATGLERPRGEEPQPAATPFTHKAWEGAALRIPAQPSPRMTAYVPG